MKICINGYQKKTPVVVKRIADAVLATTTFIGPALLSAHPELGQTLMWVGGAAKLLSNLVVDETPAS